MRLEHSIGLIEQVAGNNAAARQHFLNAIGLLESQRASLPLEELRTAFLDDKMSIYNDLVLNLLDSPNPAKEEIDAAFGIVERARARALLERLMVSMADDPSDHSNAELVARREVMRRQLHWLYNQMLGETGSQQVDADLGLRLLDQEAALQQLEWRTSPMLAQAEPISVSAIQATLGSDQQILAYFMAGEEVLAFIADHQFVHVVRHLCSVDDLRQAYAELRFQLGRAEMGQAYVDRHRTRLMGMLHTVLSHLHELLVAPLEEYLHAQRLLIVPYGVLHLLPFHIFWNGRSYMLERFELSYAPSASIAAHLHAPAHNGKVRSGRYTSFAGIALTDRAIPEAETEVLSAGRHFIQASYYINEAATKNGLWRAAAQADVLHIATHGLFRPDNSFFSALKLADGWIDVREIYRLPLAARLVILSACESGAGEIRGGDEVIGLARGFLGAGAQTLVVSLWNVHDATAATLMDRFYTHLMNQGANGRPAAALRSAQMQGLDEGQHPYYWAPFAIIC